MSVIITRSTRLAQPAGPVGIDAAFGLSPIGMYLPSAGNLDAYTRDSFSGGAALTVQSSRSGMAGFQTSVNTGLYRAVTSLLSVDDYTFIWHGVPVGTPVGTSPNFGGVISSTTSQSVGPIGVEYANATTLRVFARTGSTGFNRMAAYTWANNFGKPVTIVASRSAGTGRIRLSLCVDGFVTHLVDQVVTGGPPTLSGTENFIVGPDVIEQGSRHINSQVAFAGAFYGSLSEPALDAVLRNPWKLFRPVERRAYFLPASGGGAIVGNASASLAGLSLSPSSASASGAATASAALASSSLTPATATASGGAAIPATATAALAPVSISAAQAVASGAAVAAAALAGISIAPANATASGGAAVPATASASLAGITTTPAQASASGAATASGPMVGMNLTPAQAQAAGAAWASAQLAAIGLTPATATANDGSGPVIDWAAPGARATVAQASVLALVPGADLEALIPAANLRAIVPFAGDDMDIIKTFDHQVGDTEIYELAYGPKYLDPMADTPTTLAAFSGGHTGIASQVAVGAAVGPVVKFAVDGTVPVGTYTVSAQLATTAGRKKTAAVQVNVEA